MGRLERFSCIISENCKCALCELTNSLLYKGFPYSEVISHAEQPVSCLDPRKQSAVERFPLLREFVIGSSTLHMHVHVGICTYLHNQTATHPNGS